jgi:GT2 family glycosyltransferase
VKPFTPWHIIHLDMADDTPEASFDPDAGGVYVVSWRDGVPIGHASISFAEGRMTPEEVVARARENLPPAAADGEESRPPTGTPRASVSVVICTRDRPQPLERLLRSIRDLTPAPDEVLVVDNAPRTDDTRAVVERTPGVRYVLEPRPGLDRARNAGARAATGDVVAFADDDVEVHAGWIDGLLRGFDDPETLAVTGLVLPANLETEAQHFFETYWGFNKGYTPRTFAPDFVETAKAAPVWEVGAGANMAFRRTAFDTVGLFDERLDVGAAGCSGDSEFWYRVLAEGWKCRYEPSAIVFHHHRRDVASLKSQIFHYMRGHTAALLVQYERYGHTGNVRRLTRDLVSLHAVRLKKYLRGERHPSFLTLREEVLGSIAGVAYYFLHTNPMRYLRGSAPGRGAR